jgi:spermidine synthase
VPWHLTTRQVVAEVRRSLRPDGVYAVNVIDFPPNRFARAETATIASVFPNVAVAAGPGALAGRAGGNFVIVASASPLPLAALRARLVRRGTPMAVAAGAEVDGFAAGSPVLTDEFAPVDQLITHPGRV